MQTQAQVKEKTCPTCRHDYLVQPVVAHNIRCPWCNSGPVPSTTFCRRELVRFTRQIGQLQEGNKYGKAIKSFFEALAGLEALKEAGSWR